MLSAFCFWSRIFKVFSFCNGNWFVFRAGCQRKPQRWPCLITDCSSLGDLLAFTLAGEYSLPKRSRLSLSHSALVYNRWPTWGSSSTLDAHPTGGAHNFTDHGPWLHQGCSGRTSFSRLFSDYSAGRIDYINTGVGYFA